MDREVLIYRWEWMNDFNLNYTLNKLTTLTLPIKVRRWIDRSGSFHSFIALCPLADWRKISVLIISLFDFF